MGDKEGFDAMVTLIQRTADRLVGLVVPKVEVQARPCDCNPGEQWWGSLCYCSGIHAYSLWYTCNQSCVGATSYCRYAGNWC
jgi:hypothetical protein